MSKCFDKLIRALLLLPLALVANVAGVRYRCALQQLNVCHLKVVSQSLQICKLNSLHELVKSN